jgi:ATP-dependent Clp protease ATP-binding subunit ClpC
MMLSSTEELRDFWAEARALAVRGGEPLGSVHLLSVLAGHGAGIGGLLAQHGIDPMWVRIRSAGAKREPDHVLRQLEASAERLARRLRARRVNPHHLLAALLAMDDCAAWGLLVEAGIDVVGLTAAVHGYLAGRPRFRGPTAGRPVPPDASSARGSPGAGGHRRLTDREPGSAPAPRVGVGDSPGTVHPPPRIRPAGVSTTVSRPAPGAGAAPERTASVQAFRTASSSPSRRPAPFPGGSVDPRRAPWLSLRARDLRAAARDGALDPAVDREDLVDRLLDVVRKRRAPCACLVGAPGVGKTAVVHALAHRLAAGPEGAIVLFDIPAASLAAEGSAADRIRGVAAEAEVLGGRVLLYVGELGVFLRTIGDGGDAAEAALGEAIDRQAFVVVAETDASGWERAARVHPSLAGRFTPVEVTEPDEEAACRMVEAVAHRYAEHHRLAIEAAAREAAFRIAHRYLVGRALPDRALGLLDLAAARAARAGAAAAGPADVAAVAAEMIDVPAERLLAADGERYLALEAEVGRRIVGHAGPIARIADVLRRNAAGFRGRRPIGSFLFLGPTGVGKTETARAVAEVLFPGRDNLVRLDMSEYAEPHAVARLVGAPPGYVGHEAGGVLSDTLRRRPYCVVLFDEFEKAHPDVHRLLLQVLEDGRLTDGRNRTVDFRNAVVVMTSNLGSELFADRRSVGFGRDDEMPAAAAVLARARRALPPELYNRIDETLVFPPLDRDEIRRIARLLLSTGTDAAVRGRSIRVTFDDQVIDHLLTGGGYDPALGARPMRRAIQRLVEAPLARELLRPDLPRGTELRVCLRDGRIVVEQAGSEATEAACA